MRGGCGSAGDWATRGNAGTRHREGEDSETREVQQKRREACRVPDGRGWTVAEAGRRKSQS